MTLLSDFGLRTPAKSTVEALLLTLFDRFFGLGRLVRRRRPRRCGSGPRRWPAATHKLHGCPRPPQLSNPPAQTSSAGPVVGSSGPRWRLDTSLACSATPAR